MTQQTWNAAQYIDHAGFVAELGHPVVTLLNPKPGEKILDLGCGDGTLTEKLVQAGAEVHGVDASANMIASAQSRGLSAQVCNGEQLSFEKRFDAVFSNAALHWMTDYHRVIDGVARALKPNGRFVGEFGGSGNVAALVAAMEQVFRANNDFGAFRNPWFFPTPIVWRAALEQRGFCVTEMELIPRPTPLKSGVRQWLEVFAKGITSHLNEDQKQRFLQETETHLRPMLYHSEKGWVADYVRLRFAAHLA